VWQPSAQTGGTLMVLARGRSLSINSRSISEERQLMKVELVVETSAHSINGRHGRPDRGD
jgi:hypothetical protein